MIVFVKAPRPGAVKTRLAEAIGPAAAAAFYRAMGRDVLEAAIEAGYPLRIAYAPAEAEAEITDWLGGEAGTFIPQRGRDIGERMAGALAEAYAAGATKAVLVGSDIPALTGTHIRSAINGLSRFDAVIGPAADGGYYLIGFAADRFRREAFQGIPWSGPRVFERTLDRMAVLGLTVHRLPVLSDIDEPPDLHNLARAIRRREIEARHTAAFMAGRPWNPGGRLDDRGKDPDRQPPHHSL